MSVVMLLGEEFPKEDCVGRKWLQVEVAIVTSVSREETQKRMSFMASFPPGSQVRVEEAVRCGCLFETPVVLRNCLACLGVDWTGLVEGCLEVDFVVQELFGG